MDGVFVNNEDSLFVISLFLKLITKIIHMIVYVAIR